MKIKRSGLKILFLIFAAVFVQTAFSSCGKAYYEYTSFAMGSVLEAKIYAADNERAEEIFSAVSDAAAKADKSLSATDPGAEIYKLNEYGRLRVSDYTRRVLKNCRLLCDMLDRKLDITLGGVTRLWGFSGDKPSKPDSSAVRSALEKTGLEKVEIDDETGTVVIGEGQELDLGAFGKGAACDAVYDVFSTKKERAVITLGGAVMVYGSGPKDGRWKIGIRNPFASSSDYFAVLSLSPMYPKNAVFISTSGSYEKFFEEDGKKYHHILSVDTGFPAESELAGVTVISQSGINSDALSTACFIGGFNAKTLHWLQNFDAQAVFVFNDGTYFVTDGLKDSFSLMDGSCFREHGEVP